MATTKDIKKKKDEPLIIERVFLGRIKLEDFYQEQANIILSKMK